MYKGMRNRFILIMLTLAVRCRGVCPSMVAAFTSIPGVLSNNSTTSVYTSCNRNINMKQFIHFIQIYYICLLGLSLTSTAQCRGVYPHIFAAFTSIPGVLSNNSTTSMCLSCKMNILT